MCGGCPFRVGHTVQRGGQVKESGRALRPYHRRPDLLGCPAAPHMCVTARHVPALTSALLRVRRQFLADVANLKDRCSRVCAHAT